MIREFGKFPKHVQGIHEIPEIYLGIPEFVLL